MKIVYMMYGYYTHKCLSRDLFVFVFGVIFYVFFGVPIVQWKNTHTAFEEQTDIMPVFICFNLILFIEIKKWIVNWVFVLFDKKTYVQIMYVRMISLNIIYVEK